MSERRLGFGVFAPQGWKRELRDIADPQAAWARTKEVTLAAEAALARYLANRPGPAPLLPAGTRAGAAAAEATWRFTGPMPAFHFFKEPVGVNFGSGSKVMIT